MILDNPKYPIRYYILDDEDAVVDTYEYTIDPEGELSPAEMAIKYRDENWPNKKIAVIVFEYK